MCVCICGEGGGLRPLQKAPAAAMAGAVGGRLGAGQGGGLGCGEAGPE